MQVGAGPPVRFTMTPAKPPPKSLPWPLPNPPGSAGGWLAGGVRKDNPHYHAYQPHKKEHG